MSRGVEQLPFNMKTVAGMVKHASDFNTRRTIEHSTALLTIGLEVITALHRSRSLDAEALAEALEREAILEGALPEAVALLTMASQQIRTRLAALT